MQMRVMEQRAAILDKERAGAASQLEVELEAARGKIAEIEVRRRRHGSRGRDDATVSGTGSARSELAPSAISSQARGYTMDQPSGSGSTMGLFDRPHGESRHRSSSSHHRRKNSSSHSSKRHHGSSSLEPPATRDRYLYASPRGGGGASLGRTRPAPSSDMTYALSPDHGHRHGHRR